MRFFLTALLMMSLWFSVGCTTKATVLPDSRRLTCVVEGEKPCKRYSIDAGYLRELLIYLDEKCK